LQEGESEREGGVSERGGILLQSYGPLPSGGVTAWNV